MLKLLSIFLTFSIAIGFVNGDLSSWVRLTDPIYTNCKKLTNGDDTLQNQKIIDICMFRSLGWVNNGDILDKAIINDFINYGNPYYNDRVHLAKFIKMCKQDVIDEDEDVMITYFMHCFSDQVRKHHKKRQQENKFI